MAKLAELEKKIIRVIRTYWGIDVDLNEIKDQVKANDYSKDNALIIRARLKIRSFKKDNGNYQINI